MKKSFDCVRMKWNIQQKLMREYEGLSLEERKILMGKKISGDPVLGAWLEDVRRGPIKYAMVAEKQAEYRVGVNG